MHCGSGDTFLVCHLTFQDHVIKWPFDFMRGSPHDKCGSHRHYSMVEGQDYKRSCLNPPLLFNSKVYMT